MSRLAGVAQLVEHPFCNRKVVGSVPTISFMTNFKRKKKKRRKDGWSSLGRLHKHKRIEESHRNLTKRQKSKNIIIYAKSLPGAPTWWNRLGTADWFVWARYEKMKDAENALVNLNKKLTNRYDFKIGR